MLDPKRVAEGLAYVTKRAAPSFRIERLRQDASSRTYYRASLSDDRTFRTLIVTDLGDNKGMPPEWRAPIPEELPFVNVHRYLAAGGLPVPQLYFHDRDAGILYMEDFGDETLEEAMKHAKPGDRERLYDLAIRLLVRMQSYAVSHPDRSCLAYHRAFDFELLRRELKHFQDYILDARGIVLTPAESAVVNASFDRLAHELAKVPRIFVHRDYQSRNLMVMPDRLGLIDFQDALLGPPPYDLVALLRDSYVVFSPEEVEDWVRRYVRLAVPAGVPIAPSTFLHDFTKVALQRKLKDAGRFVFIDRVKGNPDFLPFVRGTLRYVRWALDRLPEYREVADVLCSRVPEIGG